MVCFDQVQIREFSVVVGDNPSCSCGCPIGLGSCHGEDKTISLDEFEEDREHMRRRGDSLMIPPTIRTLKLQEWDIPTSEIIKGERKCEQSKKHRDRSFRRQLQMEKVTNTINRIFARPCNDKMKSAFAL